MRCIVHCIVDFLFSSRLYVLTADNKTANTHSSVRGKLTTVVNGMHFSLHIYSLTPGQFTADAAFVLANPGRAATRAPGTSLPMSHLSPRLRIAYRIIHGTQTDPMCCAPASSLHLCLQLKFTVLQVCVYYKLFGENVALTIIGCSMRCLMLYLYPLAVN